MISAHIGNIQLRYLTRKNHFSKLAPLLQVLWKFKLQSPESTMSDTNSACTLSPDYSTDIKFFPVQLVPCLATWNSLLWEMTPYNRIKKVPNRSQKQQNYVVCTLISQLYGVCIYETSPQFKPDQSSSLFILKPKRKWLFQSSKRVQPKHT